jgi:hypothetical protein
VNYSYKRLLAVFTEVFEEFENPSKPIELVSNNK